MPNPTDAIVARLEADWPRWQIWVVPVYIGPDAWCARRRDDEKHVLNAVSPEDLVEQLEAAASSEYVQMKDAAGPPPPTVQDMREIFFPEDPEGRNQP
jgi:hypothetical protein